MYVKCLANKFCIVRGNFIIPFFPFLHHTLRRLAAFQWHINYISFSIPQFTIFRVCFSLWTSERRKINYFYNAAGTSLNIKYMFHNYTYIKLYISLLSKIIIQILVLMIQLAGSYYFYIQVRQKISFQISLIFYLFLSNVVFYSFSYFQNKNLSM